MNIYEFFMQIPYQDAAIVLSLHYPALKTLGLSSDTIESLKLIRNGYSLYYNNKTDQQVINLIFEKLYLESLKEDREYNININKNLFKFLLLFCSSILFTSVLYLAIPLLPLIFSVFVILNLKLAINTINTINSIYSKKLAEFKHNLANINIKCNCLTEENLQIHQSRLKEYPNTPSTTTKTDIGCDTPKTDESFKKKLPLAEGLFNKNKLPPPSSPATTNSDDSSDSPPNTRSYEKRPDSPSLGPLDLNKQCRTKSYTDTLMPNLMKGSSNMLTPKQ